MGPARRGQLCRLDAERALAAPGPAPTHKVTALRSFVFPGPSIKSPPIEALPFGATLTRHPRGGSLAVTSSGGQLSFGYVPASISADRRERARFCRRRGAFCRHALSVGRQDHARGRLLRPCPDRAYGMRRDLPTRQRHAGARAWHSGRSRGAVIRTARTRRSDILERARGDRARSRGPSCMPMRFIWPSSSSRRVRR